MTLRKILLGTTAVLGAGLFTAALPANAAEVKPGGYPDLTITGFARFLAAGGQLDDARLDDSFARGLDFRNDTEVHVVARAKSEEYGLEYGGTIEFEADTDQTNNTDETWIFLKGAWGELRFGDEDGVSDNSVVGGQTIAAGTGGIDGTVIDTTAVGLVKLADTDDATKIRYYTPSFGGFSVGVDYTPTQEVVNSGALNGQFLARKNGVNAMDAQNVVSGGLIYDGEFGGTAILASVVGLWGDLKNDAEVAFGDDKWWGWQAGASIDLFGFKLAGSYADQKIGEFDLTFFNAGIGAALGPVNTSVTYGQALDTSDETGVDKPYNLVVSADIALMPGLVLAGDVGYFDNDASEETLEASGTGDTGWQAVARLGLAF